MCAGEALDLLLAWGHDKQSQLQTPRLGVISRRQLCDYLIAGFSRRILSTEAKLGHDAHGLINRIHFPSIQQCSAQGSPTRDGCAENLLGAITAALATST